ncbi:MltF family protein [Marinilabilia rubra]|uniref:Lytic transglycosylase F n=1 Tax=Marinilabilia rubra TaxID=2162893 RepID=A0A2U2BCV1_9BACT|nr:transporter substrate-binding domain-containing protein [Marinilabilia rubra]PWE00892.1 lytic transglycosylase F [Marinilabilia rubra]
MEKIYFLSFLFFIFSCSSDNDPIEVEVTDKVTISAPQLERDLPELKESGVMKAIMVYSGTSYFLYRGQPMGYEYELLQRLASHLGLKLEVVIAHNINDVINLLNKGEGDIIAHGLTVTQRRQQFVNFMDYLYLTRQVLVQRKPDNWRQMKLHEIEKELISDPIELIGQTVSVRRNSAYYSRLVNLQQEIGGKINIDTIPGNFSTQKVIKMVVDGEIDFTVSDNNIAELNSSYYPILDVETPVSFSQRVSWAVRKNSPLFLEALNKWVEEMRDDVDYYVIYNKYFKNTRYFRQRVSSDFYSGNGHKISQYDSIVKHHADRIGWDWKLLSSVIYQESRFESSEESWAGARGLMQLMPATARELGVSDVTDPAQNIRGGTSYLHQLWNRWEEIPDSTQRIKFALASYNCGYSHVVDATRLADKYDANPKVWDENVETYVLNLMYPEYYNDDLVRYGYVMGEEPVNYVEQILERYDHYAQILSEESEEET